MFLNTTYTDLAVHRTQSSYHYNPTFSVGVVFLTLFSLSTSFHLVQSVYYRLWWIFPTIVLGGLGEVTGWSARVWSGKNPLNHNAFLMQITTTIISPTFILAANFIIVGRLIRLIGPQYSRLNPRRYMLVFCSCDVVSLVIQAAGGGIASGAITTTGTKLGGNIMLAGIAFQLGSITIFSVLTAEFFFRFMKKEPVANRSDDDTLTGRPLPFLHSKDKIMTMGVSLSTLCMFIRAVYRTIELANGWNGRIISTQVYFVALDGGMMIITMAAINIAHPGIFLRNPTLDEKETFAT